MAELKPMEWHSTEDHYSPWDLLPSPLPSKTRYLTRYFYENVAKHLIKDFVKIMNNGLAIDLERVEELEKTLEDQLSLVSERLASNPLIQEFQRIQHGKLIEKYIEEQTSKMRSAEYYIKPFNAKDVVHRSYFMYLYAISQNITLPSGLLSGTSIPKWDIKLIKKLAVQRPILQRLLEGNLNESNSLVRQAMQMLAQHKTDLYNSKYFERINSPQVAIPPFNPGSSKQKQAFFDWLGLESETTSKTTGLPSWDRDQIERVYNETGDDRIREITQCLIDYSYAAIVRNNFIEAFYRYTVDGRLYGQLKLFGAKTFRPTSSNPNMLNMPSTGSIFAKPVKKCFTAPPGKVVLTADYSALEDRVIANLSKDTNKIKIFTDNLDGHCLNAYGYFPERVAQYMEITGDITTDVRKFFELQSNGHKELKAIRQDGKPATFGLSYGAFPPKVAKTLKIPLSMAEQIFHNYHNVLYPQITAYREEYVLPTAVQEGELHLGLGCKIITDNPDQDIRTLANSTVQYWSILTLLAVNKFHQAVEDAGLTNRVMVTSTIYDAIYLEADADPELIKWINDTLIPIMKTPYLVEEVVHNDVDLEVGLDWASFCKIENDASLEDIVHIMKNLK